MFGYRTIQSRINAEELALTLANGVNVFSLISFLNLGSTFKV
jgi:hypothetical protein